LKIDGRAHALSRLGMCLDLALLLASLAFIFLPAQRSATFRVVVGALFFLQAGLATYKSWKSGWLTKSPRQIYEAIRVSGPPTRRRFESLASFIGCIAMALVFWS
jgi:disulfide bond formation protein DsbB